MKFSISGEFETLQDIKEKHGYVALDYNQEIKGNISITQTTNRPIATTARTSCPTAS